MIPPSSRYLPLFLRKKDRHRDIEKQTRYSHRQTETLSQSQTDTDRKRGQASVTEGKAWPFTTGTTMHYQPGVRGRVEGKS